MGIIFLLAPKYKLYVNRYYIFGNEYMWENDKYIFVRKNSLPIIQASPAFDIKKYPDINNEDISKSDNHFAITSSVITALICILISIPLFILARNASWLLMGVTLSLAFGIIFHGLSMVVFALIAIHKVKTSLSGYTKSAIGKLRDGQPLSTFNLLPVEELPYKKISNYEYILYYPIYMAYLESCGEISKMEPIAEKLGDLVKGATMSSNCYSAYYTLIYYYSFYNQNPAKAKSFYNVVFQTIEKDTDANSYRIRAHYELTVNGNKDLAYELASKAQATVGHFSIGSERDHEVMCINKLMERLSSDA